MLNGGIGLRSVFGQTLCESAFLACGEFAAHLLAGAFRDVFPFAGVLVFRGVAGAGVIARRAVVLAGFRHAKAFFLIGLFCRNSRTACGAERDQTGES